MKIKKTIGHKNGLGMRKGYSIQTECGKDFACSPTGSQGYECKGIKFKSLRDIKTHIESGAFSGEPAEEVSTLSGEGTWDCIHPCALLVHFYDMGLLSVIGHAQHKALLNEYKKTLDANGWLDPEGRPDIEMANREIARTHTYSNMS